MSCEKILRAHTWWAEAQVKGRVCPRQQLAGTTIQTASVGAGSLPELAAWTPSPCRAEALERAQGVVAGGAFGAGAGVTEALVDVMLTGVALKARWAAALDLGVRGQTHTSIDTGVGRAEVSKLALLT